ncbi:MAG: calcium/sodium antiporter [Treponema sp.]|jgi:cation:H+ antiporter|nr:calcium/sodium antiporter [Treponema sp.]
MLIVNILLIILGMALLVKGGDFLVDGASSLARRYRISELAIGLTIVAFGTSAPELVVSLTASLNAHPEIALGNVIGSNNFNLFVILGLTGIIMPVAVKKNTVRIEIPFSLLAALILFALANYGFISGGTNILTRIDGIILLLFFGLFVFYVFKTMKTSGTSESQSGAVTLSLAKTLIFIILGLVLLAAGGRLVVYSAVELALALNISQKVIGLTIVAAGTSLPELVTSITAIIKKNNDIAIGNIIGSNIFNIFLILGSSALARPMEYSYVFNRDIFLLVLGTLLLLLAMFTGKKRILERRGSVVLVLIYVGYVIYLIMRNE